MKVVGTSSSLNVSHVCEESQLFRVNKNISIVKSETVISGWVIKTWNCEKLHSHSEIYGQNSWKFLNLERMVNNTKQCLTEMKHKQILFKWLCSWQGAFPNTTLTTLVNGFVNSKGKHVVRLIEGLMLLSWCPVNKFFVRGKVLDAVCCETLTFEHKELLRIHRCSFEVPFCVTHLCQLKFVSELPCIKLLLFIPRPTPYEMHFVALSVTLYAAMCCKWCGVNSQSADVVVWSCLTFQCVILNVVTAEIFSGGVLSLANPANSSLE